MRPQDISVFKSTSHLFNVWILVRETKMNSLQYIAKEKYAPKPIVCKAKTAEKNSLLHPQYQIAGLVANPEYYKDVYPPDKAGYWTSTITTLKQLRIPFELDSAPTSQHYNCLKIGGKYLYGDYDLFDIIIKGQESRNLGSVEEREGIPNVRGARVKPIEKHINALLGCDMIKHGAAAQFSNQFEKVLAFTPEGLDFEWNAAEVELQYGLWKRQLLDLSAPQAPFKPGTTIHLVR
jgi:hypothetical protein